MNKTRSKILLAAVITGLLVILAGIAGYIINRTHEDMGSPGTEPPSCATSTPTEASAPNDAIREKGYEFDLFTGEFEEGVPSPQ